MSENASEQQGEQQNDGGNSGFTPPATQQELNRIITERVNRERAKFGDYEDLKGKAARLTELEQANLTEAEKSAQRITAAEAEVAKVPAKVADALRDSIIALGIIPEDKKVLLTASDPESLLAQVKAIQGLSEDRRKNGPYVSREGRTQSASAENPMREIAQQIFKRD